MTIAANAIRAGDLRRRISIQNRSTVKTSGQEQQTWTEVLSCWAEISPLTGRELIAAQAQVSEVTHEVTIRYRAGITPRMRIVYQGRVFNILFVNDLDTQHRKLVMQCSEGLNQG